MHPNLFSPLEIGNLELPSRIVMAPMTRGRAGPKETANELMAEYYGQRASAGLIISEGTQTSVLGRGWFHAPCIYKKHHAEAWKLVTDKVHKQGGRMFLQLWHCGRASHSSFRDGFEGYEGDMKLGVAASAVKRPSETNEQHYTPLPGKVPIETPRALSIEEVDAVPEEFRRSAELAKKAGFDGVEIHSAGGYLLDGFLQSCTNFRTDQYGGSLDNRFRLLGKVLDAVFTVFEPSQVGVRISPNLSYNGMASDDFRESFLYFAERLTEYNLGYLHVMVGLDFGFHGKGEPMTLAEFREVYPGVIIGATGFDADSAEREIAAGNCDLIAFGRAFIANPDLVERMATGAELTPVNPETFYSTVEVVRTTEGYTDYETVAEQGAESDT